jgi:hypothetical protein
VPTATTTSPAAPAAAATGPVAAPLLPPPPPPPTNRAGGGAVLASLSYLSMDLLSYRLAAAVSESLRTTGELPLIRGLLLVDVVSARWLLGPYAYGPHDRPPTAPPPPPSSLQSMAEYDNGSDSESESLSAEEEEDEGEKGPSAVDAAAAIVASDAPLTFGGDAGGDVGSIRTNPAAARVLGAAAHGDGGGAAVRGLALRDRHGRIRCDPYVHVR